MAWPLFFLMLAGLGFCVMAICANWRQGPGDYFRIEDDDDEDKENGGRDNG